MAFEEKVKKMQGAAYATVKVSSLVDDQENCIAKGSVLISSLLSALSLCI